MKYWGIIALFLGVISGAAENENKECAEAGLLLQEMQEAQRQIMVDLSSRQDLFASTLESYQESIFNSYKKQTVVQLNTISNMKSSVKDLRESSLKSDEILRQLEVLSQKVIQSTLKCIKNTQLKSKN